MQIFCPVPLELIFHFQCSLVAPGCTSPQTKGWNLRTERFVKTIVFFFLVRGNLDIFAGSLSLFFKEFNYGKRATFEC